MPIINSVIKGSGGSAPAHYIEKSVDANGKLINGTNIIDLTGVTDIGNFALYYAYNSTTFPSNTNVNFSSLTSMSGNNACNYMFYNCSGLTTLDMSSLTTISGNSACNSMFSYCTGITNANLSSLTTVSNNNACKWMFSNCSGLTTLDISSLETVSGESACQYMFQNCTGLTNANLPSLLSTGNLNYGLQGMFKGCTGITSADLSSLTTVSGSYGCGEMFYGCSLLASVNLSSLTRVNNLYGFQYAFQGCTSLTSISLPSITSDSTLVSKWAFQNMCQGLSNITLHFPSNVQAYVETLNGYSATAPFGATSGTVLFDLPATYTLTGADSVTYTRNPKYDTATALAWKVGAYGTTNFTPAYYTSGTTDPAVSDTIYSDSACTIAETTISSIA